MRSEAEDEITEILETLALRTPQRSLLAQPSGGGNDNTKNVTIGPNYIYAPGGPGGSGGGGGGGGLQVGGGKAIVSTKMSEHKANIIKCTMPHEMQQDAVDCVKQGLQKYENLVDVAHYITGEFDKKYKLCWHCVVGPTFSFSVNPDKNCYICFDLGENRIVLFKSG